MQELGDILVIPMLTYMIVPLPFYTWWVATCYLSYTEASGHSGVSSQLLFVRMNTSYALAARHRFACTGQFHQLLGSNTLAASSSWISLRFE